MRAAHGPHRGMTMAEIDLRKHLDKAHEMKPLAEILTLSPAAISGVTDKDAELLQQAFGIKTIADMGANKYFRLAETLVRLGQL